MDAMHPVAGAPGIRDGQIAAVGSVQDVRGVLGDEAEMVGFDGAVSLASSTPTTTIAVLRSTRAPPTYISRLAARSRSFSPWSSVRRPGTAITGCGYR